MIYVGKIVVNSAGKLRARIETDDQIQDFKILKEAIQEISEQLLEISNIEHNAMFRIVINKKGKKIAVPAGIQVKKEVVEGNKVLEKLLSGLEEIKSEDEKENLAESFEEFSQENWTGFISALKKEFGSRLPGYAALETFCRENYYGPANKKSMS